ncbi:ATP-binding SpoIIE family protein phosphatase [Thalassotalea sp. PLHSN55]|uniref:ATP-binding SpoIIE family protein phosphatase n=1 Tax=Thalassotalea sp. PLHSN55 TaxID=3435888 RepID=UPI003F86940E
MVDDHYVDAKLALVVDDSVMQCKVLTILLTEEGYRVVSANNGAEAVDMYSLHKPDLVLMDINMPVMNGFEAAKRIKALSQGSLAPLIFITSMDTDEAFIESINAGGDGILVRPFSPEVFKAKIKSIQRISNLYQQVKELQQSQQHDAELAEKLMSGVIESRNFALDKIGIIKKPAELFSGDIQLTSLSPNGDVFVLLGDFTGHGLRSSIGAVPLAETFRTMTSKGFSILEIVSQINQQLYQLLPADLFLAATFASISSHNGSVCLFNAGLPDAYIFDENGNIKDKIPSFHAPIGVLPNLMPEAKLQVCSVEKNDRVILISDGIVEARNLAGEMYGFDRFEQAMQRAILENNVTNKIVDDLENFCQQMPQADDISLIDIPCSGWQHFFEQNDLLCDEEDEVSEQTFCFECPAWQWQLNLCGSRLATVNPIPMAMNQINDIEGAGQHWQILYTILTELFINALDHGVLKLDSELKTHAKGFVEYFNEREVRLKSLTSGFVELTLSYYPFDAGGKVVIAVSDSGKGFDFIAAVKNLSLKQSGDKEISGRGLGLVTQLCETIQYDRDSSTVTATYVWKK